MAPSQPKTPVMVLQELAVKNKWAPPAYDIVNCIQGTHKNRFDYKVCVRGITGLGSGPSKQISKHQAAMNALLELKELGIYNPSENPVTPFDPTIPQKKVSPEESPSAHAPRAKYEPSFSYIMTLRELCAENKIPDPVFEEISDIGPPHAKEFTYECKVSSIKTQGIASTKKMAKHIAAKDMLDRIKDTLPELAGTAGDGDVSNALMETDTASLQKYAEFDGFIPDKSIKVKDYGCCLKKIIDEKQLKAEDFFEEFQTPTLEHLALILEKLELKYITLKLLDKPHVMSLAVNTNSPLTTMGVSNVSESDALEEALKDCFKIMKCFMGIPAD